MRRLLAKTPFKLWQVAAIGFVLGVSLHAWAVLAVLDDDGNSAVEAPIATPADSTPAPAPTATAAPTQPPDRRSCEEIRGTDYRSEAERDWFLRNCV